MSGVNKPTKHMATGRPEAGAHYANLYNEAQFELAELREELSQWKHMVGAVCATIPLAETLKAAGSQPTMVQYFKGLHAERDNLKKYLAAAEQRNSNLNIEKAAKMLAACMDYPWEHMPENGRVLMRKHAKDVIDAAMTNPTE